jgi:class 3 adenylate cyclase
LHFEGCTLDVPGRIFLDAHSQEVALTRREFALLVAFVGNPGRVLSRAQLRNAIDGGSADAYDRSIDMLVARLRRKIEPNAGKPQFIVTVPGGGYKFVPRVREGAPTAVQATSPASQDRNRRGAQHAERRQLTVLSCQILGFAALAAALDPEDLEKVISRVDAACGEVIARFGGTMVRALGDSVLAYFGHPKAHENDAESAVRAGLDLLRAIGGIEAAPIGRFRARIGIATGLMLVGELSSGGSKKPTAIGEALNLALHMQTAAPADSVVIGPRLRLPRTRAHRV